MEYFYRFRSIDAVLGERAELEKQEIYFASPEQLNDPMEGFKDLHWCGDQIVWKNLLRHYLLSTERAIFLGLLLGEDYNVEYFKSVVHSSDMALPTPIAVEVHDKICRLFFADSEVATIPALLANCERQIRREELTFYLRALHSQALACIMKVFQENGLLPTGMMLPTSPATKSSEHPVSHIVQILKQNRSPTEGESQSFDNKIFAIAQSAYEQMTLINFSQMSTSKERLWQLICFNYPDYYIRGLEALLFYPWYAACFVSSHNHSAMWGNYGDSHRGVCLKFRAERNEAGAPSLKLRRIASWSAGPQGTKEHWDDVPHPFQKVSYVDQPTEVDFFRSIGVLPETVSFKDWYSDGKGNVSSIWNEIRDSKDKWHKEYWKRFESMLATKHTDWRHESEYRLTLHSFLDNFDDVNKRKLRYSFKSLAGIVFGLSTTMEHKVAIGEIIQRKCREVGRQSFDFEQAYFSAVTRRIETHSLKLLSVARSTGEGPL